MYIYSSSMQGWEPNFCKDMRKRKEKSWARTAGERGEKRKKKTGVVELFSQEKDREKKWRIRLCECLCVRLLFQLCPAPLRQLAVSSVIFFLQSRFSRWKSYPKLFLSTFHNQNMSIAESELKIMRRSKGLVALNY